MKNRINKKPITYFILFICIAFGCKKDAAPTKTLSSDKAITSFVFSKANNANLSADVTATIDPISFSIVATMPIGSDVTALKANFTASANSTVKVSGVMQTSGRSANNFTNSVTYTVTAQDGSTQDYVVVISDPQFSSQKTITSFVFLKADNAALNSDLKTIVDTIAHTVVATVPSNVDVTALKARFTTSANCAVNVGTALQSSGVTLNNFSKTIIYTIVAQNNSKQDYSVTISVLPASLNIYISGFEETDFNASENTVKYWKNGVATSLSNGMHYDYSGNIAVVGADVYVLGQINDFGYQSSYWKNGKATLLRYGAQQTVGEVLGMTSSGGSIYFAGTDSLDNNSGYWKNSVFTNIGTPNSFTAHAITVNGADVYVGGNATPSGTPCYWKNGTFVNVAVPVNNYVVNGIATNGTDVYLLGMDFVNNKGMCWKNGIAFNLSDAYAVNGIAVIGNDVYVVGETFNNTTSRYVACYWKNGGAAIALTDGIKDGQATAICVKGSNFFIAGIEATDNTSAPNTCVAKYWINGTSQVSISSGTDVVYPTGIFVQ